MSRVDVVILTYKPDEKLKKLVSRLLAQSMAPERILIMDTIVKGQKFEAVEWAERQDKVLVVSVSEETFDHGGTRDLAMKFCEDADYVLMMTQDALPKNKELIRNLLSALESDESSHAVAYARQEPDRGCNIIERFTRGFNYPDEPHSGIEKAAETNNSIKSIFCSDVCAMYNRKLYDEIGGFPQRAIFNEDMVFAAKAVKAEKDVIYEPKASVIHSHNYTGIQYFKRYFDLGVSHKDFSYILSEYHSDDEGVKLVTETLKYLIRRREYIMFIPLIYHSGCKFIGMKLGKMYKRLPKEVIEKCTMNKNYWKK